MTWLLIALQVAGYVLLWKLPPLSAQELELTLGLCPEDVLGAWQGQSLDVREVVSGLLAAGVLPLLSYSLLQPGIIAVIFDAFYLHVFGRRVESNIGATRFACLYLLSSAASGVTQVFFGGSGESFYVGASGAGAGVVGAYVVLATRARVRCMVPVVVVPVMVYVPLPAAVATWCVLQFPAIKRLASIGTAEPLAWLAHGGGLAVGLLGGFGWRLWRR